MTNMISCSHWGMFEAPERMFVLPAGFRPSPDAAAEWERPDGAIQLILEDRESLATICSRGYHWFRYGS